MLRELTGRDLVNIARFFALAALFAVILCLLFLGGCATRRVTAPIVEDYDDSELSDPTPTQADLDQATRDAIAEIKAHKH
jgi:hypothetical protein